MIVSFAAFVLIAAIAHILYSAEGAFYARKAYSAFGGLTREERRTLMERSNAYNRTAFLFLVLFFMPWAGLIASFWL